MILKDGKRIDGCSDTVPIGTLNPYIGTTAPFGYLICEGQLVSKTAYPELYAICGSTFGTETATEFYLPDLRGQTIAGYKSGDSDFGTLGALIGSKYLQAHYHDMINYVGGYTGGSQSGYYTVLAGPAASGQPGAGVRTAGEGNGGNIQPTMVLNWIVKAIMLMPNQSVVANEKTTSDINTYSCNYINDSLWTSGRTDIADCDDMLKDGVYGWRGTTTNTPVANSWGTLLTLNNWLINGSNDNTTVQLATISDSNNEQIYFRERYGANGWGTWKLVYGNKARTIVNFYSTTSWTTQSTTNVDIPNASTTLTTNGGDVLVTVTTSLNVTGNMAFVALYVDDTLHSEILCLNATIGSQTLTASALVTNLNAGNHTFALKMHVQNSSNVGTVMTYNTQQMVIQEL